MAFTTVETLAGVISIPEKNGVRSELSPKAYEVSYEVTGIDSYVGSNYTMRYKINVTGMSFAGDGIFTFEYSGSGDINEEAESALKKSLNL